MSAYSNLDIKLSWNDLPHGESNIDVQFIVCHYIILSANNISIFNWPSDNIVENLSHRVGGNNVFSSLVLQNERNDVYVMWNFPPHTPKFVNMIFCVYTQSLSLKTFHYQNMNLSN